MDFFFLLKMENGLLGGPGLPAQNLVPVVRRSDPGLAPIRRLTMAARTVLESPQKKGLVILMAAQVL
jgi:hypothetical protein